MKRSVFCLFLALSLCIVPLLGGCQLVNELKTLNSESVPDPEILMMQNEKNGLWAAYFGRNLKDDESITSNNYVKQAANALKQQGDIEKYMLFSCNDDPDTQISQLEAAAANGFDVFLIDPCNTEVLECAAKLLEDNRIAAAIEISDKYSHPDIFGVTCSTARSDLAATEYICAAAAERSNVGVIVLTSKSSFGESKRSIFLQVLEKYPDLNVVCDKQYSSFDEASQIISDTFQKNPALQKESVPVVLCDRLDSRLFMFILNQTTIAPIFGLSDRLDFLNSLLVFSNEDGKVPFTFAAVNSPIDMPATAMKIAVKLAQGATPKPNAIADGSFVIDTYFLLTDQEFDSSSTTLKISDANYIATNILRDYLSEIF